VDWIQFPFEVSARVHRGPGAPIVRLRWTYTDLPFLPVGTGCTINNRVWNDDTASDLEVGQLPLVESNYVQDARWVTDPGAVGGHICHPEWLVTGEPWPTTLPDTVYTPGGLPMCCCVETYVVNANEQTEVVSPDETSKCQRWIGVGPVTGKQWVVIVPFPPGIPYWRVLRRRNGAPTFYEWRCAEAWDGRGTSPPFVLFPPGDPGAPVEQLTVSEVVP